MLSDLPFATDVTLWRVEKPWRNRRGDQLFQRLVAEVGLHTAGLSAGDLLKSGGIIKNNGILQLVGKQWWYITMVVLCNYGIILQLVGKQWYLLQ